SIVMIFVIVVLSMIGKFLTGYIGGKFYGLSKRASMTAGFSIINRGEFSIVISKLSPANFSPFFGVYILIMAITGILFAQYAPKISKFLVKPQKPAL
ncbi:MAG: cation:proton antiporter, partial [Hydrogenothermaceae bacterium]